MGTAVKTPTNLYGKRRLGQIDSADSLSHETHRRCRGHRSRRSAAGSAATRVFFGATVTYKDASGLEHVVSIVEHRRGGPRPRLHQLALASRQCADEGEPGDRVNLRAPAKTDHLEIIEVEYAPIPMDPFREPLGAQSTPKVERS